MSKQIDDGGPAFPLSPEYDTSSGGIMRQVAPGEQGMSLRDYFAANAISQCIWLRMTDNGHIDFVAAARAAYEIADTLLAERNQPKQDL